MERSGARLCLLTVLGTALFSPAHSLCSTPRVVLFKENNKINDTVFTITPKHEDVTAAITHQEPEDLWALRGYNFTANTVMDYETFTDPYTVIIECKRDGFTPSTATVTIILEDVNDNPPTFAESQFTISVDELTKVDTSVARITATDPDISDVLYYSLDSPEGEFALLADFNPDILVKKLLDYDEVQTITMTLYAQDTPISVPAEVSHTATATVIVNVQDIALFSLANSLCLTPKVEPFKENNKINDTVFTITPKHEDVTAAITHQEPEDLWALRGYNVTANTVMDYETFTDPYTVTIECKRDGFTPSTATVTIVLEDVNDNPPTFAESQFTISVDELTQVDTSVARITATDPDITDTLYYSLDSPEGEFALLAAFKPDILVKKLLDYDEVQTITMTLYAQDTPISVPAEVSHTATATVIVNVQDIDNRPPWFQPCTEIKFGMSKLCLNSGYQGLVNLNEQATGPLTLKPDQVFAIDGDKGRNEAIEYTFLGGNVNDTFVINVTTGNITMKKPVEVADPIVLSVMAYQQLNIHQHATTSVMLQVVITSKHPPRFLESSYKGFISEDAGVDSLVLESPSSYRALRVQVTDDDFANGFNPNIMLEITNGSDFSITPEGFILMTTDVSPGRVNLQMRVVDTTNEESSTASLTVQVAPGVSTTTAFSTITTDQTSRTVPTDGPTITRPDNTSPSFTALTPTGAPTTTEPEKTSPSSTVFTSADAPTNTKPDNTSPPSTAFPSTSPQTTSGELRPKEIYTAEDMGALGGSLAVLIALCLVCIVLLVCKIRNHKLDWKRLSEASLLQSTLMRGSSGDMKTGLQYSNQDYEDFGSVSSKIAAELEEKLKPEEHHLSTASAPQTIAVDSDAQLDSISSGGSDATDATDREVKPILTKERRAEDGYKAVWFKQDIQKEEDVVIIPDHEDSDEDHQDEDDDDVEVELRDRFKASHRDADTEDTPTTEL